MGRAAGVTGPLREIADIIALLDITANSVKAWYDCDMEKLIKCTKCENSFEAVGGNDGSKEIDQPVTCPHCGEPNEVKWPMNMDVAGQRMR